MVKLQFTVIFAIVLTMTLSSAFPASALIFDVDLFYTRFSSGDRVKLAEFSYDDSAKTFSGLLTTVIATDAQMIAAPGSGGLSGADGIVGDPNDITLLLVGGQATGLIFEVNKAGGVNIATSAGISDAFHLEVSSMTNMYASDIPGALAAVPLSGGGGTSGPGVPVVISGPDTVVTQIITTPSSGFFYTNSGTGGIGSFGSIAFAGTLLAPTATTTQLAIGVPAHGGVHDPFSGGLGDIILFGDDKISQWDLGTSAFIGTADLSADGATQLDQGTADGFGHLFVADNVSGDLFLIDYKTTANVFTNDFIGSFFMDTDVDDVAPLVGMGMTPEPEVGGEMIPIDTTMVLLGATQTAAYWLIPVIVAGIAIAIVIARKF